MFNVRSSYTFLLSRKSVIFFLKMTDALTAKLKDVSITNTYRSASDLDFGLLYWCIFIYSICTECPKIYRNIYTQAQMLYRFALKFGTLSILRC